MPTRNVNLTEELDRFVLSKIESGRYKNASEVVRAALRTLEREEQEHEAKLAALRAAIDEGDTSGIAGSDVFSRVRKTLNFQPHGAKEDLERFGENQLPGQCTRRPLKRPLDGGNTNSLMKRQDAQIN